jgi:hypothetical protein
MSGRRDYSDDDIQINATILSDTIDEIVRSVKVIRTYDIPYVAGYSKDKPVVYIDRNVPPSFTDSKGIVRNIYRYLILHEAVEKSLIDVLKLYYQHAHQIALRIEVEAVKADGLSWDEYDQFIKNMIPKIGNKTILQVPKDLNLTPYIDKKENEILVIMRNAMVD